MKVVGALLSSLVAASASAAVYRCERDGKTVYTDVPCAHGSEPTRLPPVTAIPGEPNAPNLANQYDRDQKHDADAHAAADREWLKQHAEDARTAAEVRSALIDNRVVKGMTRDEVRRVLNNPLSIDGEAGTTERWRYQSGRERRTITFKNGVVISDTARNTRK